MVDTLNGLGHTATLRTASSILAPGETVNDFDLIVVQHINTTLSQVQAFIDAGVPVFVFDSANGTGLTNSNSTDANHIILGLELAASYRRNRYFNQISSVAPDHFITDGLASPATYLQSGNTAQGVILLPLTNGGALVPLLAMGDTTANPADEAYVVSEGAALVGFEKGLLYTKSGTGLTELPVRIAFGGIGAPTTGNGSPTGYGTDGITLVGKIVDWLLGNSTAVDPIASFYAYPSGLILNPTDASVAIAPGAEIASMFWSFNDGEQTSQAVAPTFIASAPGTYQLTQVVWDSNGNSNKYSQSYEFGPGVSEPPYDLPTMRAAGRILIRLERSIDWTGVTGVVEDTDGGFWLDYNKLPKPGGGTECRWKSREVTNGPDQPVRTLRLRLILDGLAGNLSSGATDSPINRIQPGGAYSAAVFGAREVLVQVPLGDPDSTDPEDWLPRFHGYLDDPESFSNGLAEMSARDVASRLQFSYRGRGIWIGDEGEEILLGDAIQRILDVTTRTGLWKLKVQDGLDWGIEAFQLESTDDVLEYINKMARNRGAVVRWWPDEDTGRFQLTLFVLQADKVYPDLVLGPGDWKAGSHGSDTTNVRTERTLDFIPAGATEPISIYRPATEAQIEEYGTKSIVIGTDQTRHIKTVTDANVMLDSVDGAVLLPATVGSRVISPSRPTIDVNSLLQFDPDPMLSDEAITQYVGDWSEREEISDDGSVDDSITVKTRNVPTGTVGAWLAGIAGIATGGSTVKLPPTWKILAKWVTHEPIYDVYTGSVAWRMEPHGLLILDVRAQTKFPGRAWSEFGPPDRGPGDYSEYFQRTLANYEYEKDVLLDNGGLISSIAAETEVEAIVNPISMFEINLDADNDPEVTEVNVYGLDAEVKGDDDTLSLHIEGPVGSGYSASFDTSDPALHTFASIPVPSGQTWEMNAYARNTITADPIDKVSAPFPFTVVNTGEPSLAFLPEAPPDGSGTVALTLVQATGAPSGYRLRMFMSYQTYPFAGGAGTTFGELDVTAQLSPSPLGQPLPTTPTTYSLSTDLVRDDAGADEQVVMQFRGEIVSGAGVVVDNTGNNPSLTASWGI